MDDWDLLNQYVKDGAEDAFEELVRRYSGMIYASAIRRVGPEQADDVTQAVFIILARKAEQMHKREAKSLAGWLYKTTRYAASEVARSRKRRQDREEAAMEMQQMITEEQKAVKQFKDAKRHVDSALDSLSVKDREAIILRFFQGASYAEVGVATGMTENTATKRVARALEKLRASFARAGVVMSVPIITNFLIVECSEAATTELISACAVAPSGTVSAGAGLLAEGAVKLMVVEQVKVVAMVVCTAAALGAGAVSAVQIISADRSEEKSVEQAEGLGLRYMGRNVLPDGSLEFQFNTPDNRKTYFVVEGDVLNGYEISEYRTRMEERNVPGIGQPKKVEVSELVLTKGAEKIILSIDSR